MENKKSSYFQSPHQDLGSDLYLLQINPDISANLGHGEDGGYLFSKKDGEWARIRKMTSSEHEQAWDQVSDMAILDASKMDASKNELQLEGLRLDQTSRGEQQDHPSGFLAKISQWVGNRRNRSADSPVDSKSSSLKSTHQPNG